MRFIARKLAQTTIAIGTDQVVAANPIPQGGKLNSAHLDVSMILSESATLSIEAAVMYNFDGYVVPVPDPDAALGYNAAWDRFVPKDVPHGTDLEMDTTVADTSVVREPGQLDPSAVFDMVGLAPRKIFSRHPLLTFAKFGPSVGNAAVDDWNPSDAFVTKVNQTVRCNQPSYVMFGAGSPALTTTSVTIWAPPASEQEWAMLQYLDMFLEMYLIKSLELVETGAETPYEDAEVFIENLLEDVVLEINGGSFVPSGWVCYCRSTMDISVPGRPSNQRVLTSVS